MLSILKFRRLIQLWILASPSGYHGLLFPVVFSQISSSNVSLLMVDLSETTRIFATTFNKEIQIFGELNFPVQDEM